MWPWEHAIVGYLAYSIFCHCYYRDSPDGLDAFAVVFGSVFPDLVDKPLAWEFGVFETGYAVGHSLFVAVPGAIAVGALARSYGRTRAGVAFGVGYLLHLPGDLLYDALGSGGELTPAIVLWPLVRVEGGGASPGFVGEFARLFGRYRGDLLAGELSAYVWFQLALAGGVALLWLYDGAPVVWEIVSYVRRRIADAFE